MAKQVMMGFDPNGLMVPITNILPLKQLRPGMKATQKYQQVLASVREVGIIEPLIVFPDSGKSDSYFLLDGHVRLEVLKQLGATHARCLVSTDDEAYTYNKRVSRIATIQEHVMILNAIKSGVSEERIAKVLDVDVARIRQQRDLLEGICKEASDILKNRFMSPKAFSFIRKMKPMRQIEVAELLSAANNFSVPYIRALLASTHPDMLVDPDKSKIVEGLTPEQVSKMEKEMEALQRDLKSVEETYGNEVLNLVLARGYLTKLLNNARVVRYLSQHYPEILNELQTVSEGSSLEVLMGNDSSLSFLQTAIGLPCEASPPPSLTSICGQPCRIHRPTCTSRTPGPLSGTNMLESSPFHSLTSALLSHLSGALCSVARGHCFGRAEKTRKVAYLVARRRCAG